jgi:hypothetical protein
MILSGQTPSETVVQMAPTMSVPHFHRLFGATLVSAIGTGMHAAAMPLDRLDRRHWPFWFWDLSPMRGSRPR